MRKLFYLTQSQVEMLFDESDKHRHGGLIDYGNIPDFIDSLYEIYGVSFDNLDISYENLSCFHFENCSFVNTRMTGCILDNTCFIRCNF